MSATIRFALSSLLRNRLRTGLTTLAVGIGIAAVICTAALGAAGTSQVQAQIDALGEDFLWIRAGNRNVAGLRTGWGGARTLTAGDAAALAEVVPEITMCSPQSSGREQIVSGARNWNARYQGVQPSYFQIRRRTIARGTFFTAFDEANASRVVVLGQVVAERVFGQEDPVGRTIRMNRFPFKVIGVVSRGGATRGGVDRDDVVFLPFSTAIRSLDRRDWVSDVICGVSSPDVMDRAEWQAASVLRLRHRLTPDEPDDFQVEKPIESLEWRASAARTMTLMLTAIGAVSLLVGGVGIMNVMLVSVAERKQEIGVRLAIGARMRDIRWQFLLEAAGIGLLGGALGVAGGWTGAWVLSTGFDWPTVLSTDIAVMATSAAIGAGIVFGYYPAHRASGLDPIEAIRLDD